MIKEYGTDEYGENEFTLTCNKCGRDAWITPIHYYDENKLEKITLQLHCTCGNKYGATIHHEFRTPLQKNIELKIKEETEAPKEEVEQQKEFITISGMVEKLNSYCETQDRCKNCKIEHENKNHTCGYGACYISEHLPTNQEIELNYNIIKNE